MNLDLTHARWFKSTRSSGDGNCVETAFVPDGVAVRDTKDRDGGVLGFPADTWTDFIDGVKAGEFDRP